MRTIINATLNFGAIFVPVGVAATATKKEIEFRTLHVTCSQPIKLATRCEQCDMSLSSDDVVKGYEFAKDNFVVIDVDAMKESTLHRSTMIELGKFVDWREVDPLMVEKTYWLKPNKALARPYQLLVATLGDEGLTGIGRATLWSKEYPIAVDAHRGALVMKMLFAADELVPGGEIAQVIDGLPEQEVELTKQFLRLRSGALEVSDLSSGARDRALTYIGQVIAGQTPEAKEQETVPEATIDMLAKLREMVAAEK